MLLLDIAVTGGQHSDPVGSADPVPHLSLCSSLLDNG